MHMNDSLTAFEEVETGNNKLKYYIVACVSILIAGVWVVEIVSLMLDDFASFEVIEIGLFVGSSLFFMGIFRFFLRKNKIAWCLMSLVIAFFSGIFVNSIGGFFFHSPESGEYWRFIIFVVVSICTFTSFVLLLLARTKRDFSINNILYGICVVLCMLLSIVGYFLVR